VWLWGEVSIKPRTFVCAYAACIHPLVKSRYEINDSSMCALRCAARVGIRIRIGGGLSFRYSFSLALCCRRCLSVRRGARAARARAPASSLHNNLRKYIAAK
jgi:hypothetical protein